MKKVILGVVMTLTSLMSFGQVNHPTKFELVLTEQKTAVGILSVLNTDYVVVDLEGTVEENYKKVVDFINATYKNPKEVIVAQSENEYVKINGFAPNLEAVNSLGMLSFMDVKYTITYFVKDGKMKVELGSIENYVPSSQYSSGGWYSWSGMATHKANGKEKPSITPYKERFENYFNDLVNGVVEFKNTSLASTDNDW
jgi:hypothetical protein